MMYDMPYFKIIDIQFKIYFHSKTWYFTEEFFPLRFQNKTHNLNFFFCFQKELLDSALGESIHPIFRILFHFMINDFFEIFWHTFSYAVFSKRVFLFRIPFSFLSSKFLNKKFEFFWRWKRRKKKDFLNSFHTLLMFLLKRSFLCALIIINKKRNFKFGFLMKF